MGKTLKRQRQRQLREEQQQQQQQFQQQRQACKLPRFAGLPPLTNASSSSKFAHAVSLAMQAKDWLAALQVLQAMAAYGKVPKLGSLQRWVRDADQAADEAVTARLIDAMLRCQGKAETSAAAAAAAAAEAGKPPADALKGTVKRHTPWIPSAAGEAADTSAGTAAEAAETGQQEQQQQQEEVPNYAELFYQVPFQPGAGGPDAIYAYPPGTVKYDADHPPVKAVQVPFVPGAVCLLNVLSARECAQIVAAAEAIGYNADVDYTFGGAIGGDGGAEVGATGAADGPQQHQQQRNASAAAESAVNGAGDDNPSSNGTNAPATAAATGPAAAAAAADGAGGVVKSAARGLAAGLAGLSPEQGGPAAGCVWLVDDSVLQPLYQRVVQLLPQELGGGALAGINARWRLYRYTPGNVYRPHVDGAWPGSGTDAKGQYVFDAFGDRWSRLTFLVYLNDDFEGGHTTYYTPSEQVGCLDARGVVPVRGNVMVFPHGGTVGSLVHEGSAVVKGAKYVIRTDVMYMKAADAGQRRQQQQQGQQQRQQKKQKR